MAAGDDQSQTFGERMVRVSHNPSNDSDVDELKRLGAAFIDKANELREKAGQGEAGRCYSVGITQIELGTMMAVKGATTDF